MITGYTLAEALHEGHGVVVARAVRQSDGRRVVIKMLREASATHQDRVRLRYEFKLLNILKETAARNIVCPVELIEQANQVALVSDDIGGYALQTYTSAANHGRGEPLTLKEVLHVATDVCEGLKWVHAAHIVHKDITPNNIIYNRHTGQVQLIDFGISTQVAAEMQCVANLRTLEGTLAFISPEQTGRMNRLLDYRSDFYSLGATLYALLSGKVAFAEDDISRLVHAVLAKAFVPLQDSAPHVPSAVVGIVHRLMQKVPEDRYQSTHGIAHDLRQCSEQLQRDGTIAAFPLATQDRSERFSIPPKLYGRQESVATLLAACAEIGNGKQRLVVVEGPSGIGKSALINAIQGAVVERNGLFLSGKFDQLRRHIPFNAFGQAIAALVRSLLVEPEEALTRWRRRIAEAVGGVGQALVDLAPALQLLLGPQKALTELGPQENENRLLMLFSRFVNAVCAKQPLVLFLDDMQWADLGTLKLVRQLLQDESRGAGLLLILAFRDNEVQTGHPLRKMLGELQEKGIAVERIHISALGLSHVQELLADTLHRLDAPETLPLAEMIMSKTAGNPFFVREFLEHLVRKDLLAYDRSAGRWVWNLESIAQAAVTDNVLQLMTERLQTLPPQEHRLLSLAACLGHEFSLLLLCDCFGLQRQNTAHLLGAAESVGLLMAATRLARYAEESTEDVIYAFSHDRIQQAAFEMLSPAEAVDIHYTVGKHLLRGSQEGTLQTDMFAILGHLNPARSLMRDAAELQQLAELNYQGAREAKRSAAYSAALEYLDAAQEACPSTDPWTTHYEFMRSVQLERVDNEFLCGQVDQANGHLDEFLALAHNDNDRAEAHRRRALCLLGATKYVAAIEAGARGLALLNFPVSLQVTPRDVKIAALRCDMALWGKNIRTLVDAPTAKDPEFARVLGLLSEMVVPAFFANPTLYMCLSLTMMRMLVKHGNTAQSAFTFAVAGVAELRRGHYPQARALAQAARDALKKWPDSTLAGGVQFIVTTFIDAIRLPPRELARVSSELFELLVESGDPLNAGLTAMTHWRTVGLVSVEECLEQLTIYEPFVTARHEAQNTSWAQSTRQMCLCLAGRTAASDSFSDGTYNEAEVIEAIRAGKMGGSAAVYFYSKMLTLWIHRHIDAACEAAAGGIAAGITMRSTDQAVLVFSFFGLLSYIAQARSRGARALPVEPCTVMLGKLRLIAAGAIDAFAGLPLIVDAELAALAGKHARAARLFEQGTHALAGSGYPAFIAAGNECAGRYFLSRSENSRATVFLRQAHNAYRAYGAKSKTVGLEREFEGLYGGGAPDAFATQRLTLTTTTSKTDLLATLDLPALMQVSQTLAAEKNRDHLVAKVLDAVCQCAGATRAVLLFEREGRMQIEGDSVPQAGLPEDVIALVTRTCEALVLDDATQHLPVRRDPYIQTHQPRSLLCAPLMQQGSLKGIIYLENTASTRAFTVARLQAVELLAGQATISLENLRTYAFLEDIVERRTQELRVAHGRLLRMQRDATESQMAGGFAHEMRNALAAALYPLGAITSADGESDQPGLLEVSRDDLQRLALAAAAIEEPKLREEIQGIASKLRGTQGNLEEMLGGIHGAVERGLRITKQILEYAQVGSLVAGDHAVQVGPLVDTILGEFRHDFATEHIVAQTQLDGHVTLPMREDHAYAVVRNLIANARDALTAKQHGDRSLYVRVQSENEGIRLSVEDSGVGMSETVQARVFQPFFSTKGAQSTGLGLGLSRKLAQVYGGDLHFTSRPEEGTTFSLFIPTAREMDI